MPPALPIHETLRELAIMATARDENLEVLVLGTRVGATKRQWRTGDEDRHGQPGDDPDALEDAQGSEQRHHGDAGHDCNPVPRPPSGSWDGFLWEDVRVVRIGRA